MVPEDDRLTGSDRLAGSDRHPAAASRHQAPPPHYSSATSLGSNASSSSRDSASYQGDVTSSLEQPRQPPASRRPAHSAAPVATTATHGSYHQAKQSQASNTAQAPRVADSQTSLTSSSSRQHHSVVAQPPPPPGKTSSRCITLRRYGGDHRAGSLDSISKSSDSSANSSSHDTYRLQQTMPPRGAAHDTLSQQPEFPLNTNRSLDNLDTDTARVDMGNVARKRSRSGERAMYADSDDAYQQASRRYRGNRATEELRRKFFENGLMPQGGPVYGAHSLSTSALHRPPPPIGRHQTATRPNVSGPHAVAPRVMTSSHPDVSDGYQRQHQRSSSQPQQHRSAGNALHESIDFQSSAGQPRVTSHDQQQHAAFSTDNYGLTVSLAASGPAAAGAHHQATHADDDYQRPQQRFSLQEQNVVNLVTARKKIFESDSNLTDQSLHSSHQQHGHVTSTARTGQSNDSLNAETSGAAHGSALTSSPFRYGSNSVSSKTAFYERSTRGSSENVTSSAAAAAPHQSLPDSLHTSSVVVPPAKLPLFYRHDAASRRADRSPGRFVSPSRDQPLSDQQRRSRSQSRDRERTSPSDGKYDLRFLYKCIVSSVS